MNKTYLIITSIVGIIIVIVLLIMYQQSKPQNTLVNPDTPAPVVKKIKLVHYLPSGKQEVVEFDCQDILTRLQIGKTNTTLSKETLKVSSQSMQSICQNIGGNLSNLRDTYGNQDGKNFDYSLTILTENGSKTIYFNLGGEDTPQFLQDIVTTLETVTGVPVTPTPTGVLGNPHVTTTPTNGPTAIPTIAKKATLPTPTDPPSLCSGYKGPEGSRPAVLTNTVCTP